MTKTEILDYKKYYSDSKFWNKLGKVAIHLGSKVCYYALTLYYVLKSPDVSLGNKAIIMGALGYLILPLDLIPDAIPIAGLTDDAAALKLAYETVKASVTPDIDLKVNNKLSQWF